MEENQDPVHVHVVQEVVKENVLEVVIVQSVIIKNDIHDARMSVNVNRIHDLKVIVVVHHQEQQQHQLELNVEIVVQVKGN